MRENLVIGAAIGYRLAQVRPFLESLKRTGYRHAVALLVDRRLARQLLQSEWGTGLTLHVRRQWLPLHLGLFRGNRRRFLPLWSAVRALLWVLLRVAGCFPHGAFRHRCRRTIAGWLHPPHHTRFLDYRQIIAAGSYTHILMSDVRDVVFQCDPFPQLPSSGLAVSLESRKETLATEPHNAAWLRLAYGDAVLRRFGDQPVSCSGVTFGDRDGVLRYLSAMEEAILALPFRATDRPLDQAPHNALVWSGALGEIGKLETLDSAVATLHGFSLEELRFDERGFVLNRDGSAVSILHMYDRVRGLAERLLPAVADR